MQKLVISPVGISLFFNSLNSDERALRQKLNEHSNDNSLPGELSDKVKELSCRITKRLREGSISERRRLSAELNGLYALYDNRLTANGDFHILVATDTVLGKTAAGVVEKFLREEEKLSNIDVVVPQGLNTASVSDFSGGIKKLLNRFEQTIPGYVNSGYEVIFNLTGGFKSLQGYLNIIGMFYADRLVYIFERSDELLTIPRLPLRVDEEVLSEHAVEMARLTAGGVYPREQLHLPGALLDVDEEGDATLSDWGLLVWNRIKGELLSKDLLKLPFLEYEQSFRKEFKQADDVLRVKLQETISQASVILEEHHGDVTALKRHRGLQYDNFTGTRPPIGHFRIDRGQRITCVYLGGKLYLRHFGSHDYTERVEGVK